MVHRKNVAPKSAVARKGLVICYIGNGKGKTSAAMGVAARASGAGLNVFVLQFVKAEEPRDGKKLQGGEWPLSHEMIFFREISTPENLGRIDTEVFGKGFVGILGDSKQRQEHVRQALSGLERARQVLMDGKYELVVLDELISALELGLIEERDVLELIAVKPDLVHMVMTGHKRFKKVVAACDLVTEMKMVKHPYYQGILAQRGIDF